jgi:hypothetical protein
MVGCGDKYYPGHQCKNPTVHLLTNEEYQEEEEEHQFGVEDSEDEEELWVEGIEQLRSYNSQQQAQIARISLHALQGDAYPET